VLRPVFETVAEQDDMGVGQRYLKMADVAGPAGRLAGTDSAAAAFLPDFWKLRLVKGERSRF
jgi:hypothetical protein